MEAAVIVLLILMLVGVAYAQWHRGAVRTIGSLSLDEEESGELVKLITTKPQRPLS
ncbi:MAG: hypothetical protein ACP5R2_06225 [Anaerolineae bacterium]